MTHAPHAVLETTIFTKRAGELALSRDAVAAIVSYIASNPQCGDVMEGTGGAHKVRFAAAGRGKSGGVRVVFCFAGDDLPVILLTAYGKNERANLSGAEKNAIKKLLKAYKETFHDE